MTVFHIPTVPWKYLQPTETDTEYTLPLEAWPFLANAEWTIRVKRSNAAEPTDPTSLLGPRRVAEIRGSFAAMVCIWSSWRCHGCLRVPAPPRDGRFGRRTTCPVLMSHSGLECDSSSRVRAWCKQWPVGHDASACCACTSPSSSLVPRLEMASELSVSPNRDLFGNAVSSSAPFHCFLARLILPSHACLNLAAYI